jgi:hypothetical protein
LFYLIRFRFENGVLRWLKVHYLLLTFILESLVSFNVAQYLIFCAVFR